MTPHQYLSLPQSRAFMEAIAAQPADDLPRLVMADDMEEHGFGEVAAFIRISMSEPNDIHPSYLTTKVHSFYMIPRICYLRFLNVQKNRAVTYYMYDQMPTSQRGYVPTIDIVRGFPEQIQCTSREVRNDPCECQHPASIFRTMRCTICGGTGTIISSVNRYAQFWPMSYVSSQ